MGFETEIFKGKSLSDLFSEIYDNSRKKDKQIADAILTVFSTRRDLEIFKKKALYIYIREMTDCKTPHLTRVIKTLKDRFYELYEERDGIGLVYR